MAPTLNLTQSDRDLKDQMREILLEEGGHCIGLLRHLYRNNPRGIRLLREVSWGWTTVHLRPGVMEELGDPYSLPAGAKRCYRIRTIYDSAGPYSGQSLYIELFEKCFSLNINILELNEDREASIVHKTLARYMARTRYHHIWYCDTLQ